MKDAYKFTQKYNIRIWTLVFLLNAMVLTDVHAQLKLGNNPTTINPSALLELESTNQGLLLSRLNNLQINSITTPPAGLLVYNTDSLCIFMYAGGGWKNLCNTPFSDFMQFLTSTPAEDSIIKIIANNAANNPLRDSIFNAVLLNAHNLSAASGLVTITNGTGSILKDVTVDLNRDSVFAIITAQAKNVTGTTPINITGGTGATLQNVSISIDSNRILPIGGLPGQVVTKDSSGNIVWQTNNSTGGDNWGTQVIQHNNTLDGSGTASSPLGVDSAAFATLLTTTASEDTIVNLIHANTLSIDSIITLIADSANQSPLRDSIFSTIVSQGRNVTGATPIIVLGGAGASLQNVNISIDSTRILPTGGTSTQILAKDSFGNTIWENPSAVGDNWGTQVIQHNNTLDGSGTTSSPLGVDSAAFATLLTTTASKDTIVNLIHSNTLSIDSIITLIADSANQSPLRDSIFSTIVNHGRNVTGATPIIISGGGGASLQNVSISIDSTRILPTGGTTTQILAKDSFGNTIWENPSAVGDNWGTQVIQHNNTLDGNGTSGSPLGVDSSAFATMLSTTVARDTILQIVNAGSGNLLAGNGLVSIANGTGATLHNTTVNVNADSIIHTVATSAVLKDSVIHIIATNSNTSPLRDSIYNTVAVQAKALTSNSPVVVINNGQHTTLANTSVSLDSLALIRLLINSHLADSLYAFDGFNAYGSTTSGSFLNLSLGLGSNPNVVNAYQQMQLTDTTNFPSFNTAGAFHVDSPSYFKAPVTGYYTFTYTVNLVINPAVVSAGGIYSYGIALIKTNGTPTIIQANQTSQTVLASVLGLVGVSTVSSNSITALVKLTAGDKVSVGVGAGSGVALTLIGSTTLNQRFSGYLVK